MELQLATPSRSLAIRRGRLLAAAAAALAMIAVLLAPQPAHSQGQKARRAKAQKLERKGLDAYAKGDYAAAASSFEQAYELSPNEHILFAWGQAERFRGNCRRAVELFEKMLKTKLSQANRSAVQTSMDECKARIAAENPQSPDPVSPDDPGSTDDTGDPDDPGDASDTESSVGSSTGDTAAPESADGADNAPEDSERVALAPTGADPVADPTASAASAPPPGTDSGAAWYSDPIGGALTGTGVVALGVGIGLYVSASSANSSADESDSYVEFSRLKDQARSRGRLAVASMSAGAVLVGAGVAWYVMRGGSKDEAPASGEGLSVWWHQHGGGIGFAGHF